MNLDAILTPIYPDDTPEGWQRIGAFYRRRDGFLLREFPGLNPPHNLYCKGLVELFVVAPGDWLLLHEHFDRQCNLDLCAYGHGETSALVGSALSTASVPFGQDRERLPNDFTFWMNAVNRAIPMRARQEKE